jgi:prepilin-type N-terminal cleavage/methylation domain-containing protein
MTKQHRLGFTLVELLIAMAIFTVVTSIATGAFIRALRTQRQLVSFAAANSNLSLVLEQMAREIRVGRNFEQPDQVSLKFKNAKGEDVTYSFDEQAQRISRAVGFGAPQALTSDNVSIRQLSFQLQFAGDDAYPARITIMAAVAPKEAGVNASVVHIQTTVSARNIGT